MTEATTMKSANQNFGPAGPAPDADAKKQTGTKAPAAAMASRKPNGSGAKAKVTAKGARKASAAESNAAKAKPSEPRKTKAATVEAMLSSKEGATLEAMCAATSWQAHTCRAFLTGLRKKGREVVRYTDEQGGSIYRMTPLEVQKGGA